MNTAFSMLVLTGVVITAAGELFAAPLLRLFGATDGNLPHALAYLHIYLLGTIFTMLATGLNPYINAQGFASTGMFTVVIGAVTNILLASGQTPSFPQNKKKSFSKESDFFAFLHILQ